MRGGGGGCEENCSHDGGSVINIKATSPQQDLEYHIVILFACIPSFFSFFFSFSFLSPF